MSSNTEIIQAIQGLRAMLESLEARVSSGEKAATVSMAPAAVKPKREASPALIAWNTYVDQVKADMASSGWKHPETGKPVTRKDAMQEASLRKASDPTAPKPLPKAEPKPKPKPVEGAEAKPRKPMTEEHKAKLSAGRKAAAERKKAEAEAEAATATTTTTTTTTAATTTIEYPPLPPSPPSEEGETLTPIAIKARKYLLNPYTNGCYKRKADGSKGDWAGVYNNESKSIDASIAERAFD